MSFHQLSDKLEWSDYTRPQVEANLSRYKFRCGRWMCTRLHNEIDEREDYAYIICVTKTMRCYLTENKLLLC
jgi:hypothetical protein